MNFLSSIVTHNSVPARSLKELIALARSHPGKLNFSSSGAGSTNHLACELLRGRYKLDMVHVPYKGAAPALIALMSGQVDWGTMAVPPAIPHVQANRVRGLAVLSEQRIAAIPQVPTSTDEFASFIGAETVRYAKVIREANIRIE